MQVPIEFGGRKFFLDDVSGSDAIVQQMREGGYEAPLPMLVLAVLSRTKGLFCDVGANNGLYTVLACQAAPTVNVAAFEPFPPVLEALRKNISINRLEDRVIVREVALSDSEGTAVLYVPDPKHGLLETSCSLESAFKPDNGKESIEINRRCLDTIENELAKIELIKVDIEGHELSFLRGAIQTLKRHRPIVFAEMLPASWRTFYEVSEIFNAQEYRKFRLRPNTAIETALVVVDHLAWNYAFVPREKLPLFENCCRSHNLELLAEYRP